MPGVSWSSRSTNSWRVDVEFLVDALAWPQWCFRDEELATGDGRYRVAFMSSSGPPRSRVGRGRALQGRCGCGCAVCSEGRRWAPGQPSALAAASKSVARFRCGLCRFPVERHRAMPSRRPPTALCRGSAVPRVGHGGQRLARLPRVTRIRRDRQQHHAKQDDVRQWARSSRKAPAPEVRPAAAHGHGSRTGPMHRACSGGEGSPFQ